MNDVEGWQYAAGNPPSVTVTIAVGGKVSATATLSRPIETPEGSVKLSKHEQIERCWEEHEGNEAADVLLGVSVEIIGRPKCHVTKQSHAERLETTRRAGNRHERNETHPDRELTPLTHLERIRLHNGTIDLKDLKGKRLNHCDRSAVRKLKRNLRKADRRN